MLTIDILRFVHVISACILLGTGAGIAFFMLMAVRSKTPSVIAAVANIVVIADMLFTATAVIVQPLSGYALARLIGWPLDQGWILLSMMLYVMTGIFWLPVVWIQIRLRNLARLAAQSGSALPPEFHRLYRIWFACGFPAFFAVIAIIWLMLTKPQFPWF